MNEGLHRVLSYFGARPVALGYIFERSGTAEYLLE
jgi:hypothetical protein